MNAFLLHTCRAQIAKSLTRQRYGFVFGCNMFLALLIETILTAIVVDEAGFGVDVQTQVKLLFHQDNMSMKSIPPQTPLFFL